MRINKRIKVLIEQIKNQEECDAFYSDVNKYIANGWEIIKIKIYKRDREHTVIMQEME